MLLSPSFSREDESKFPRALDVLSRVLGHLPYAVMLKLIGPAMKSSLPPHRRDALVAELEKNDPRFLRRQTRRYLEYLDRHGRSPRACANPAFRRWVVFGERDDVGLTDEERSALAGVSERDDRRDPERGHFALNQEPGQIAELVLEALSSAAPQQ